MLHPLNAFQLKDAFRNRWLLIYGIITWLITDLLIRFSGSEAQVLVSLSNVLILFIPLIAAIQGGMYVYSNRDFVELMLTQPVTRHRLWFSLWTGFIVPFVVVLAAAIMLPFLYFLHSGAIMLQVVLLIGVIMLLAGVFSAVAFWISFSVDDRTRGLASLLGLWIGMAIIYDGLILIVLQMFADYPIDGWLLGLTAMNPIDLGRITMLLNMDTSSMMGYTGALFKQWMGPGGIVFALVLISLWIAGPLFLSYRTFNKKDF